MKKTIIFGFLAALLLFMACENQSEEKTAQTGEDDQELLTQAQNMFKPISSIEMNAPDEHMVALGQHLYYDTRLSATGNISCNSCHDLNTYGVDNKQFSEGDDGSLGGRNSPTVIHAALHSMQFWDGRAKDVEEQAGGPILNPVEHNIKSEAELVGRIKNIDLYKEMFAKAFTNDQDPITFNNITKAIGAFERTLMPESKFDKYLEGNIEALTVQERKGLKTFINSGCITCHSGVALGGQMFQKFGLYGDYWKMTESDKVDDGRYEVTQGEGDKFFFKVPGLRNIVHTAPYFHDGSVKDLRKAVQIMAKLQRDLDLSQEEIDEIVTFLGALSSDVDDKAKQNPFAQAVQ